MQEEYGMAGVRFWMSWIALVPGLPIVRQHRIGPAIIGARQAVPLIPALGGFSAAWQSWRRRRNVRAMSRLALIPVCIGLLCAAGFAQEAPVSFEVASVKPARPDAAGMLRGGPGTADPEAFTIESFALKDLITYFSFHLRAFQVSGPAWIENTRYDIAAKVAPGATKEQRDLMMQNLLVERFRLKFHYEEKTHAAYDLVVDKRGFKLKPPTRETDVGEVNRQNAAMTGQKAMISMYAVDGGRGFYAIAATVNEFRGVLESQLDGVPVLDKTGIRGTYNFRIQYVPGNGATDSSLPSLFTAVEECCGLKLQPVKANSM